MINEATLETEESTATDTPVVEQTAAVETSAPEASIIVPVDEGSTAFADETPSAQHEAPGTAPVEPPPVVEAPKATVDEAAAPGDIDFGAILEQFEQEQTIFHAGELVDGTVVGISDRGILVDFGYKSEGVVPVEEMTGPDGELIVNVGDAVQVVLKSMHSGDGPPVLSRLDALARKGWDDLEKAFNDETTITGLVVDKTKGGLRVDINGVEAFLPGSQIDSRPIYGLDSYKGQEIEARIIKFSRRRNNVVLSRRILTDEVVNAQKAETLGQIEVGYVIEGTIKNLTEYGAFVDIGGIDGLLHVTDMSWGRIHHPADVFKVGDHIQVKVLKLDREREKISLGYKQLLADPWSTVIEVYPVNTKLMGKVSSVTDYGVFVELEAGVEGLVHVSEISWSRRAQSPKRIFNRGDEVEVQVLGVDTVEKRISLGMKQFQANPWDSVVDKYPVGTKIHGRVRNLTDFGAFVELEEGIDGLVHVSDITWAKKIKHPKDVLKKDQEVDAVVTHIDKQNQRLSLSMKDLTPSAWEGFVATHRPGDTVRGKVSRFTNFGIFVELGEGLEGLCHISELSDERVENTESVAEIGQEMDFKILRIDTVEQKIGLSHRSVGKDDEPHVDTKMYSTEAKGGMASLGELANMKFTNANEEAPKEETPKPKKEKKVKAVEVETAAEPTDEEDETPGTSETPEVKAEEAPALAETSEVIDDAPASAEGTPVAENAESTSEAEAEESTEASADAEPDVVTPENVEAESPAENSPEKESAEDSEKQTA